MTNNEIDIKISDKNIKTFNAAIFELNFHEMLKEELIIESVLDISKIHEMLFEGTGSLNGRFRTRNVIVPEVVLKGKSVNYLDHNLIVKELLNLQNLFDEINKQERDLRYTYNVSKLIYHLWIIRPFMMGNVKTIFVFIYFILKQNKFNLSVDNMIRESRIIRNALVLESIKQEKDYLYLRTVLDRVIN